MSDDFGDPGDSWETRYRVFSGTLSVLADPPGEQCAVMDCCIAARESKSGG